MADQDKLTVNMTEDCVWTGNADEAPANQAAYEFDPTMDLNYVSDPEDTNGIVQYYEGDSGQERIVEIGPMKNVQYYGEGGQKRRSKELAELHKQQAKWARKDGAILASSRTAEGYSLPTGNQLSCKPDALFNGLKTLGFEHASLARLRTLSIAKLGLKPMASWESIASALTTLGYPFSIEEATRRFMGEGGPMLNLLRAPPGVYLVSLLVTVEGVQNKHCVMLSTIKERHAPFGKLIDNHGKMVPAYLQKKDTTGKEKAKAAWKLFIGQNPAVRGGSFAVHPMDVYELVNH